MYRMSGLLIKTRQNELNAKTIYVLVKPDRPSLKQYEILLETFLISI